MWRLIRLHCGEWLHTGEIHYGGTSGGVPQPLRRVDGILPKDEVHVWQVELNAWEKEADSLLGCSTPKSKSGRRDLNFQLLATNS